MPYRACWMLVAAFMGALVGVAVSSLAFRRVEAFAPPPGIETKPPPVLRAERFELIDRYGRVRGRMDIDPRGEPVLDLMDEGGRPRVRLGITGEESADIRVLNSDGKVKARMGADAGGLSVFELLGRDERARYRVDVREGRDASMRFIDPDGHDRLELGVGNDGAAHLSLLDGKGNPRARLDADAGDRAALEMFAPDGHSRAVLRMNPGGASNLVLNDEAGRDRIDLYANSVQSVIMVRDGLQRHRALFGVDEKTGPKLLFMNSGGDVFWNPFPSATPH